MTPFEYVRASDVRSASSLLLSLEGSELISGGTSQVDLMKEGVQRPSRLVDISRLDLREVTATETGGVLIGANVSNTEAAEHPLLAAYAAIPEALHAGASQQIRNVASMAGNPLQRTRCPYLRDPAQACNKRAPGTGCAAVVGFNRMHAIFGQTDRGADDPATCIAVHPSDLAVALAAHEAELVIESATGGRRLPFAELHRLPGEDPSRDTTLNVGEVITAIELPPFAGRSHYLKVRDRASYAYGLVSCAAALEMDGERIARGRVALGSVAAKPWRVAAVEALLAGRTPSQTLFGEAADLMVAGARTYAMNAYKAPMARALVRRALAEASGLEAMQGPPGTALAASVGGLGGLSEAA